LQKSCVVTGKTNAITTTDFVTLVLDGRLVSEGVAIKAWRVESLKVTDTAIIQAPSAWAENLQGHRTISAHATIGKASAAAKGN
jgi:hypothetical protein